MSLINFDKWPSGGLTPEKKAELKKIAYSKFTSSEIEAVQKVVTSK